LQFVFCEKAGDENIILKGEIYNYLFKVRRHKSHHKIFMRNPESPKILYKYSIKTLDRRKAELILENSEEVFEVPQKLISVGWCVVDSKTIEKTLPMINELGVQNIYFIFCEYSQRDIKLDFSRFEKILQNSSMQSGRFDIVKLHLSKSLEEFFNLFPETVVIDFSKDKLEKLEQKDVSILVGAEGGFSENERETFKIVKGLSSPYILKSQTALISAISLI
jgi:16S rRNA (uracil1498-N3)-methyltransferase